MKSETGIESAAVSGELGIGSRPGRSLRNWAREIVNCRLCRNLTLAAFTAILVIEVAILIPSYRNYEEDLLSARVDVASQAIITFLKQGESRDVNATALQTLIANSPLAGISMTINGSQLRAGQAVDSPHPADGVLRAAPATAEGMIDLSWGSVPELSGYDVAARVDVSDVPRELVAFVFRILGLSLLIAMFVTAVTMFVVDRMMLSPLLKLRERINRAGKDAEHPMMYVNAPERCDEFGEVEGAFNKMLQQNASYLTRLQTLNQRLDQLLEERTRSLRETEQELEVRTHYDQLTGLANRNLFEEQLDRHFNEGAARAPKREALLVLGLNDFQTLNGVAGHQAGDQVLREIARRLSVYSSDQGHIARLGGDIFGLLVAGPKRYGAGGLEASISAIIEACQAPIKIGRNVYECEISAGVAVSPWDGNDAKTLLSRAEIAMQRAKKSQGERIQFFAEEFGNQVHRRQEIIRDLKVAARKQQLQLHYQPQFDQLRRCVGYEALVRWHHPLQGLISPAEFIPLAEETGLILGIGDWVLEDAIGRLAGWIEHGFEGRMAVNLSAVQLSDPQLCDRIEKLLTRFGVGADRLELEITETALMNDVDRAMATLERFRVLGLELAVDDFGTGYSSLAYLKALPVSRIKIDRAFVVGLPGNEQDETLCRTIITMAHSLGCEVIAEGVETEDQAIWLIAAGCDELQGFLLGRPALKGFS